MADVVGFYEKTFAEKLKAVQAMSTADLTRTVDFFGMMQQPAVTFLGFANNHSIHHRGQLAAYLRPWDRRCRRSTAAAPTSRCRARSGPGSWWVWATRRWRVPVPASPSSRRYSPFDAAGGGGFRGVGRGAGLVVILPGIVWTEFESRYRIGIDIDRNGPMAPAAVSAWPGRLLVSEGARDAVANGRTRTGLRAVFPQAVFREFAEAGHGLALEQPTEWLRVVSAFLRDSN